MTARYDDYLWDPATEPDDTIVALERALKAYRHSAVPMRALRRRSRAKLAIRGAGIAVAASVVLVVGHTLWLNRPMAPWSLAAESGNVGIQGDAAGRMVVQAGDVLVTDAAGRARLRVGSIGDVYLSPESEVEITAGDGGAEQLLLHRGELHARIWAPPRRFAVATRWATAIDLGCVFTIRADSTGNGSLEVYQGAVELAGDSGAIYLAAGTAAQMGIVPGVPWPIGSAAAFRAAALALASGADDRGALEVLLADTTARATITLWHLLPRVDVPTRAALVSRIAQVASFSPDVAAMADRVAQGDVAAMAAWESALRPQWSSEPDTAWRRFLVRWRLAKPIALLQQAASTE